MHRLLRLLPIVLVISAVGGIASLAGASTPDKGTVSASAPSVKWTGTVISGFIASRQFEADATADCNAPVCDHFELTVGTAGGTLTIKENLANASASGAEGNGGIRVISPDGTGKFVSGTSGPKTALKFIIKNAPAGKYSVDMTTGYLCCTPSDYMAVADLVVAGGAPAPAPGTTPAPSATPGGPAPVATPTPVQTTTTLAVTGPAKASAKKLNKAKKLVVSLKSTGPLSKVNVFLSKGKKVVGKGSVATLNGAGTVTLKLKGKLKKGTYGIAAGGVDAQGRNVNASRKLKITK